MAKKRKVARQKTKSDAKESKTAAEKPKRRVSVGRKPGIPGLPVEVQSAIAKAVADLGADELQKIVLDQEVQLNALRTIMFDLLIAFRKQAQMSANTAITKRRWADFVREVELSLAVNIKDLMDHHPDKSDIDDLLEEGLEDPALDFGIFEELTERIAAARDGDGYSNVEAVPPEEWAAQDADLDLIDEMLERASEETENEGEREAVGTPYTRARRPRRRSRDRS
jgi:hypothetical protein